MKRNYFFLLFLLLGDHLFGQDFDAKLVKLHTVVTIEKGVLTTNWRYEIQVNNREGENLTKIRIPYSSIIKLNKLDAYILDSKGIKVQQLKKNNIKDRSSISDYSFYEDDFVKEFSLKHNTYPYTLVYSYQTIQKQFVNVAYWIPLIYTNIPTINAKLEVITPLDYKIAFKNRFIDDPLIDTVENSIKYIWNASYTDLQKGEEFAPPIDQFLPKVEIVPIEFFYDKKGSFYNWESYGNWHIDLLKGMNELPEREKNVILSITKDIDSNSEKIRKLYYYLQDETRYINVSIETGGLKPHPASYVSQNKYGDCKALTNYFKSILDFINIQSYYSTVNARDNILEMDKEFPSQQANHVILYIPQADGDMWLDCTSNLAFGYLGTFTQNRDALIISKDNSRIIKTTKLTPNDVLENRTFEIKISMENTLINVSNVYKGDSYERLSYMSKNYTDLDIAKYVRNNCLEDGFQLLDYELINLHRDSTEIRLKYNATSTNVYKKYGNEILASNIAFTLPFLNSPEKRKLPIQIDYPIHKIDTIYYEIPKDLKLNQEPMNVIIENKFGEYFYHVEMIKDKIRVIKRLLIHSGNYPLTEYEEFYNFYTQVLHSENKTKIILSK